MELMLCRRRLLLLLLLLLWCSCLQMYSSMDLNKCACAAFSLCLSVCRHDQQPARRNAATPCHRTLSHRRLRPRPRRR